MSDKTIDRIRDDLPAVIVTLRRSGEELPEGVVDHYDIRADYPHKYKMQRGHKLAVVVAPSRVRGLKLSRSCNFSSSFKTIALPSTISR